MRKYCDECVLKHLAQAIILIGESLSKDYEHHIIYAIGHIAEAEVECADSVRREMLRDIRKQLIEDKTVGQLLEPIIIDIYNNM